MKIVIPADTKKYRIKDDEEYFYELDGKLIKDLPPNLQKLYCSDTNITKLPDLPSNLRELDCDNIRWLPKPPENIGTLYHNFISLKTWKELWKFYEKRLSKRVFRRWRSFTRIQLSRRCSLSGITLNVLLYEPHGVEYRKGKQNFDLLRKVE